MYSHPNSGGQVLNDGPFHSLPKLPSAMEIADVLVVHVFRLQGLPTDIVLDRGPQFTSRGGVLQSHQGFTSLSSSFYAQTNRQSERTNQDLKSALGCVSARHPASWCTHPPWVEYAHNSLASSATGMSLFMVAYGFQPPLFPSQEQEVPVPLVKAHLRRCHQVWRHARAALSRTALRNW